MKRAKDVSLADQATIPLHLMYASKDVEMNNGSNKGIDNGMNSSVTDLIGMIDSGAAEAQVV